MEPRLATTDDGKALARRWVADPVVGRFDVGDHVAFVFDAATGAATDTSARQLGFQAVKDLEPGHEP